MIPKAEYRRTVEKRGGTGTRRQASPNPHPTHIPEAIVQVVYE
jgi:hypothetical protein